MHRLHAYIDENLPRVNAALGKHLPAEEIEPRELHEAMRYSVLGGGKRLRPLLLLMSAGATGATVQEALPAACAIECVHAYSLIHDDLPAMDNDEIRRGRLTTHKAYDEATAILAGDALLTLAFELLTRHYDPARSGPAVLTLARAAGPAGMVGGQMLDLRSEGLEPEEQRVERIDRWKTGALLAGACCLGGIVAYAAQEDLKALSAYGYDIGTAYQILDDLLDIESTEEELGKKTGKDATRQKMTYPALLGTEPARELARDKAAQAKTHLKPFGKDALLLRLFADYVIERKK